MLAPPRAELEEPAAGGGRWKGGNQSVTYIRKRLLLSSLHIFLSLSLSSRWRRLDGEKVEEEEIKKKKTLVFMCICLPEHNPHQQDETAGHDNRIETIKGRYDLLLRIGCKFIQVPLALTS